MSECNYNEIFINQLKENSIPIYEEYKLTIKEVDKHLYFPTYKGILTLDNDELTCDVHIKRIVFSLDLSSPKKILSSLIKLKKNSEKISLMPKFIGVSFMEGKYYLAILYEYIEGRTLSHIMNKESHLLWVDESPTDLVYSLSKEIALNIHDIHSKGIYHTDINPLNIYVSYDNKTVRLVNFEFKSLSSHILMSVSSAGFENALYNAPELYQIDHLLYDKDENSNINSLLVLKKEKSQKKLDSFHTSDDKVDIWSFGLIISELFSEEQPWANRNIKNLFVLEKYLIENRKFSIPYFFKKEEYRNLGDLIEKCTEQNPQLRPNSDYLKSFFNNEIS